MKKKQVKVQPQTSKEEATPGSTFQTTTTTTDEIRAWFLFQLFSYEQQWHNVCGAVLRNNTFTTQ